MTQQLQTLVDAAWQNRANLSPAAAPKEVSEAREHLPAEVHARIPGLLADDPTGFEPGPDGGPRWPDGWESDDDLWDRLHIALTALARLVPDGDVLAVSHGGVVYALERRLGALGRPRLSNLDGVHLEVTEDGDVTVGERISLVDPTHTVPIESDRI